MNPLVSLLLLAAVAAANAGVISVSETPGIVSSGYDGTIIKGPDAKATVLGPDGSHITGVFEGGVVVAPAALGGHISASVAPGHITVDAPVAGYEQGSQHVDDYSEHF